MADGGALPLVFLPGMDGAGDLRGPLIDRLSPHRVVDFIAYPEHQPLGYQELLDLVLPTLPAGRFVVLGESFGGPLAVEIAARFKERVAGLILAATYVRPPLPSWLASIAEWMDPSMAPHGMIEWIMLDAAECPKLRRDFRRLLGDLDWRVMRKRSSEALGTYHDERLKQTTCPVMCLAGRQDHLMGRRSVNAIVAARPDTRVHWLDAPHMLLETHPDAAASIIEEFCGSVAK